MTPKNGQNLSDNISHAVSDMETPEQIQKRLDEENKLREDIRRRVDYILEKVLGQKVAFSLFLFHEKSTIYLSNVSETGQVFDTIGRLLVAHQEGLSRNLGEQQPQEAVESPGEKSDLTDKS